MIRYATLIMFFGVLFFQTGCSPYREIEFSGQTMGTTYHIRAVGSRFTNSETLKRKIDDNLKAINQSMSTYIKESEISQFNNMRKADKSFPISSGFYEVMKTAEKVYDLTQGAWDGTIDPLVNLWGFGREGGGKSIPDPLVIEGLLSDIGFDQIDIVDDPPALRKKNSRVTLDLASIAKGFGVDEIGKLLSGEGIKSYIVEIGGEILAKGLRPDGKKWRVGINRPHKDAKQDEIIKVVHLKDQGFATSGNYRNFVEIDGKMYSHVLDPRSGYPIDNQVVSVSIVAPNCTLADGLATAVMVMGAAKGIELLDRLEGVEGLVITETAPGKYTEFSSRGFSALY